MNKGSMHQKHIMKGTMKLKKLTSWPGRKLRAASLSPKKKSPRTEKCESPPLEEKDKLIEDKENNPKGRQTQPLSNMKDARPCFLFEDNEDDNDIGVKTSRLPKFLMPKPIAKSSKMGQARPNIGSPSKPPLEIMVDHLAVPPSPMREPNVNVIHSPSMGRRLLDDYQPSSFLDSDPHGSSPHNPCIGDPLGDIAMHRQLMDAQRLVRIILGKPFSRSQEILDANSILQAIRSFALMKAELMNLRKKQEINDGDPPAILETLGSPTATTPGTTEACAFFGDQTTDLQDDDIDCDESCKSVGHQSAEMNEKLDAPLAATLEESNEMVRRLQAELATANRTISELKEKMEGGNASQDTTVSIHQIESPRGQAEGNEKQLPVEQSEQAESENHQEIVPLEESIVANEGSRQLAQNDLMVQEESKQDGGLDLLLEEIVLMPQQGLTKDAVREKLELYYQGSTQNSSQNQILEMKKKMQKLQVESDKRILEMENQLKRQDENHKKQIEEMVSKQEHTAENPISVLKQLSFEDEWEQ